MSERQLVVVGENGFPRVELADVPNAGTTTVDHDAQSGNPNHDSRSGKFAKGGSGNGPEAPDNVDIVEWYRMLDAARDAAREFDMPDEGDIKEFLAGRARNPGQVDVQGFLQRVMVEKLNDAVDVLDQQMRQGGSLVRGRRRVRVVAPRGYMKRLINQLDDDHIAQLAERLEARGHAAEEVDAFLLGRVKEDRQESIRSKKRTPEAVAASNWEAEALVFDDERPDEENGVYAADVAKEILSHMPQPIINLEVPVTIEGNKPVKKIVHRDARGLIEFVEEV